MGFRGSKEPKGFHGSQESNGSKESNRSNWFKESKGYKGNSFEVCVETFWVATPYFFTFS